jgi:nicotinamidase-related amidase
MNFSRAVLIPVDMQQAFDGPGWPRRWNQALDANGLRLLQAWRGAGFPIVHVRHDSIEPGSTLRFGEKGNLPRPGFEPREGEPFVAKSVNAAFIGTDLDLRLRRLGVDTLVVFGLTTDMCVSTTIRVGANMGYRAVMVADACDCFDLPDGQGGTIPAEEVHRAHVASLAYDFAQVTTTDAVVAELSALSRAA